MDDGGLVARRFVLVKAWKVILRDGPRFGLFVKEVKSLRFWPAAFGGIPDPDAVPADMLTLQEARSWGAIPVRTDGCDLLGAPLTVSGADYVRSSVVSNTLGPMSKGLRALTSLLEGFPQVQCAILRASLGLPKLRHVLATIPPSMIEEQLASIDDQITETVAIVLDVKNPSPFTQRVWKLPQKCSGLGFGSAQVEAAPAFISTLVATRSWREFVHHKSVDSMPEELYSSAWSTLINALPKVDHFARLATPFRASAAHIPPSPAPVVPQVIVTRADARSLLNTLSHDKLFVDLYQVSNVRQRAILFTGMDRGARTAVTLTPRSAEGTVVAKNSFRRLAKYASGVPLFLPRVNAPPLQCHFCGDMMDVWGDHTSTCRLSGLTSVKHNGLRDLNRAQLKRANLDVSLEPVGLVENPASRPADVLVRNFLRSKTTWIDHTVVGPFSSTLLNNAALIPGHAVWFKEKLKRKGAEEACEALGAVFAPFAVSTVGGLGNVALAVLRLIAARTAHQCRTNFGQELGFLIREATMSVHRGNNTMWEQQEFALDPLPAKAGGRCKGAQSKPGPRDYGRRR